MPKCLVITFDITDTENVAAPNGTKILSKVPGDKGELIRPDSDWSGAVLNLINAQLRKHPKIEFVFYSSK